MEYSSKKPLVSAPAGFEPVPIPKNPHEDVDSMRVIGPADTDAMRVNPSPNDPTLSTQTGKRIVKQQGGFQFRFSPSEEAMFKALEESGWYDRLVGESADRKAAAQCMEEELLTVYEVMAESNFKKAMSDAGPGFDPNKYADEHKAKLGGIWRRIIDRNKTGGTS